MEINDDNIAIIVTCDDDYTQHLGTQLISLFMNSNNPELFTIYFLDHGIKEVNRKSIIKICNSFEAKIEFLKIDAKIFRDFHISDHINQVTYYRIMAPLLLENKVRKAIYLDSDLIIKTDIRHLYNEDLKEYIIGAVSDPHGKERLKELGIKNGKYFNAGVLLIDIEKWNRLKMTQCLVDFIEKNNNILKYWDQDALNAVLCESWKEINVAWNAQTSLYINSVEIETDNELLKPKIIHYTTGEKPWNIVCRHPFKNEYYSFLRLSEWRNYTPIPPHINDVIKNNEKVIVFGTGYLSKCFVDLIGKMKVLFFVDNNQKLWNKIFYDKVVKSPKDIIAVENPKIIVCSSFYKEIRYQLLSFGFEENKDFFEIK